MGDLKVEDLLKRIMEYNPNGDLELVKAAYSYARQAHQGQFRYSGEEYILHPLTVAMILANLEMDVVTIAAALLHDVVEDTQVGLAELEAQFGKEIAQLVDGVSKLGKLAYRSREEQQAENIRKMFLAMAKDVRVVLIKLADRLHNMRTLKHLPPEKQRVIANETLDIFAPLAHRLGISHIKWELEDLSLRYLEPDKYHELIEKVAKKRQEREEYIAQVVKTLAEKLEAVGIKADIQGRPKHFYSIYKKMYVQGRDFADIYDLIAVRVIVDSVKDCYGVLGIVHTVWKPIPGRFKDFISVPKSNLYQSLHTTVIGPNGEPFEIQIRTWEMHRTAEYGIAAHWRYKEGRTDKDFDKKLAWLRGLLDWQSDLRDAREFVETLRTDLFADEVFVFTPKGDVVDLPAGATPLDFAYQIHTAVGHRCVGAKVNGKIVPLDSAIKTGDIVEILTSKTAAPSADWLNIVKTTGAKSKIKQWFKREKRDENLAKGHELIDKEIRRQGLEPGELWKPEWLEDVSRRFNVPNEEELIVSIGFGAISAQQVVARLRLEYERQKPPEPIDLSQFKGDAKSWLGYGKASQGVRVKGIDNVLIRFSRCCNPVPGDPIVGYITRGRGVSIHRIACPNLTFLLNDNEKSRLIETAWDENAGGAYPVEIQVTVLDKPGMLAAVATAVAECRCNILSARTKSGKNRLVILDLVLEIKDLEQLQFITQKIARIRDVMSVERVVREAVK